MNFQQDLIKLYKVKDISQSQAIMFCDRYFKQLVQSINHQPASDITLISTHLLYKFSQNKQIVKHIFDSAYRKQLQSILIWSSNQLNQLSSYGSYFTLLLGIIINFTAQQPELLNYQADISKVCKLLNQQDISDSIKINILFYLQQVSQNRSNLCKSLLNNILDLLLSYRQQNTQGVIQQNQNIDLATGILINSFLHLKDNYEDKDLIQLFQPQIVKILSLFTTKEFYDTFLNSLKDTEKDFPQNIIFLNKSQNQFSVQVLQKLVDCLYLFVRADKKYLNQYYPLLREIHVYYTKVYDICELNDQLNAVITHALSE